MLLALELIVAAATPITQEQGIRVLFASLTGDLLLDALVGALFALISYSSLAAVLLTATLTSAGLRCVLMLPTVELMARFCNWLLPNRPDENGVARPRHFDPTALATPSLALANAVRETLRIGDLIDTMLVNMLDVLRGKQTSMTQQMRTLSDDVEVLYSAVKLYLAQMPREDLGEHDSRRWAEIIELAINLKLASDLIERMLRKVQQQKTSQRRSFSETGLEELVGLQTQLIENLRLGLTVFLNADPESARQLLREKRRFRAQERRLAHNHVKRLQLKITQSIETSSMHLELIADMQRLNSLFCGSAYVVLENTDTGALEPENSIDTVHSP